MSQEIDYGKYIIFGLEADRPAFGTFGRFYYATDTSKVYFDAESAWVQIPTSLPALTADLDLGTHKLINVVDPADAQDGATKAYVDDPNNHGFESGFQATLSAAQSVAAAATDKIAFDTEQLDGLAEYDPTTNYRFTANAAGRYLLNVVISHTMGANAGSGTLYLYKNGADIGHVSYTLGASSEKVPHLSLIEALAAGDYIEAYVYSDQASTVETSSFFSGQRVK